MLHLDCMTQRRKQSKHGTGEHMTIIEWLRDKNSTENKDNILAPCMDAQTAVNFLIDYLIGDAWYVAYPACTEQVNTEAVIFILQKFSRKYKKELKAWNRRYGDGMDKREG